MTVPERFGATRGEVVIRPRLDIDAGRARLAELRAQAERRRPMTRGHGLTVAELAAEKKKREAEGS